jgi:hypothetical protein
MYALLFPSAQRFISPVLENVKVDERTMGVLTGPPIPKCDSPAWMALVASLQTREFTFFIRNLSYRRALKAASNLAERILHRLRANRNVQFDEWQTEAEPIWRAGLAF